MCGKLLRSGKTLPSLEGLWKAETVEQSPKHPKVKKKEAAMCDTILEELKSLRSDLTSQIKKISDDFTIFRSETGMPVSRRLKAFCLKLTRLTT